MPLCALGLLALWGSWLSSTRKRRERCARSLALTTIDDVGFTVGRLHQAQKDKDQKNQTGKSRSPLPTTKGSESPRASCGSRLGNEHGENAKLVVCSVNKHLYHDSPSNTHGQYHVCRRSCLPASRTETEALARSLALRPVTFVVVGRQST